MASFQFIDSQGTGWMILPGLPADHPDAGERGGSFAGLTFRASTGEVRVLPRAAIPHQVSADPLVAPLGMRARVRRLEPADWEGLLRQAREWPLNAP